MGAVNEAQADGSEPVDVPSVTRERLEAFGSEVLADAMKLPVQMVNGGLYLRGLIEQGPRKSLEPMVARLGEEADYQSMQQFLAVSGLAPEDRSDPCERFSRPGSWTRKEPIAREATQAYAGADHPQVARGRAAARRGEDDRGGGEGAGGLRADVSSVAGAVRRDEG